MSLHDTIAAIATPAGKGGIGIIRVSGKQSLNVAVRISAVTPEPGKTVYASFRSADARLIDKGMLLYFKAPRSFTGEDVIEFHCHGSDVVLEILLQEIIASDVRLARPGEFTERAFLNNKIDLVQAEAVADLIDAKSRKAARSAITSLTGKFSDDITHIKQSILSAKALLEAGLDFPDEEDIELDRGPIKARLTSAISALQLLLTQANTGAKLNHRPVVAIIGRPNVGKSSILNYLAQSDIAIVSSQPGTTRDLVKQTIMIADTEILIVDTAGVRESQDMIEQEGITRSYATIETADLILHVTDSDDANHQLLETFPEGTNLITLRNKSDLLESTTADEDQDTVFISAKTGQGMDRLFSVLREKLKLVENDETVIIARKRHIVGLEQVLHYLQGVLSEFDTSEDELLSELLRQALASLDDIVGVTTADDILGEIFSSFCIGK